MVILTVTVSLLLVGALALIPLGLRSGDRPGEAHLLEIVPALAPRGATVTLTNPGPLAVLVGMSLRPAGRLRFEGEAYVSIRTRSTASELLASRQATIAVLAAGETGTFVVPAPAGLLRGKAELVAVFGQRERLRIVHRLIRLPRATSLPAPPPRRHPSRRHPRPAHGGRPAPAPGV